MLAQQDTIEASPRRGEGALARNVRALLAKTEYRRCETPDDFDAVSRLRYKAYTFSGMAAENDRGTITDELDETVNCYCFGVFVEGALAGTFRIHHLTGETPFSPAMKAWGDMLWSRLARGETFIDPTRFAADPDMAGRHRAMPYVTIRLAVLASDYFKATSCLGFVKEEHSGFYHRIFRSKVISEPRTFPGIQELLYLMESPPRVEDLQNTYDRFPFFRADSQEMERLFGRKGLN